VENSCLSTGDGDLLSRRCRIGKRVWYSDVWLTRIFWLLVLVSVQVQAAPPSVQLILEPTAAHQAFQAAFVEHSRRLLPDLSIETRSVPATDGRNSLIVAVGASACHDALKATHSIPILCTLTPRQAVQAALAAHPGPATALYLDQPFVRQANLIALALPHASRIGSVFGPISAAEHPALSAALKRRNLRFQTVSFTPGDNLVQKVNPLFAEIDALLAVPDPAVFSPANVYPLLLAAYYHQVPLIGYSESFVEAGALVAVYSEPAQIGQQTAEWVTELLRRAKINLPPPQEPRYFTVRVNRQLARSLALELPAEDTLARRLAELESSAAR